MRKFILGLIVGVIAVYLWQNRRIRFQATKSRMPEPDASEFVYADRVPSYQTAPLADYRSEYQAVAEELFEKTVALVGRPAAEKCTGSYSFLAEGGSTAAKIIIYERSRGQENGAFPMLQEGVYALLRTQRSAPNTLGVAPKHEERFHYRRVDPTDLDAAAQEIADVLQVGEAQWNRLEAGKQR